MRYKFPEIRHLDDVRPAIEGRDEFIVAQRDWGFVVNYMVSMSDTFPPVGTAWDHAPIDDNLYMDLAEGRKQALNAALRRECRGILFYPDGRIMARRLHKFFNVNERDETQHQLVDLSQPHVILEKLDGSMITPMVVDNAIRWGTKMGLTGVAEGAEEFVSRHNNYYMFADQLIDQGKTPIFEWCSRKQRIVVDYPSDRLVLIAVRDNITGEYSTFNDMWVMARDNGIDLVRYYEGTVANMEQLISDTRDLKGVEGWVVRFDDGHMVKIKAEEYVRFHKTKDGLSQEKNVVEMIVNEKIDDAKSFMMDEDRTRVEMFEEQFWYGFNGEVDQVNVDLNEIRTNMQGDRKRFALEVSPKLDPITRQVMFACWDSTRDVRTELLGVIKKNVGTQTKIDGVRHLWGGNSWTYGYQNED